MGLLNGICDSCGKISHILFPVGILDELPTGGMGMVRRWYCVNCKDELEEEATDSNNGEDNNEE